MQGLLITDTRYVKTPHKVDAHQMQHVILPDRFTTGHTG
jgi:hypothetical protein